MTQGCGALVGDLNSDTSEERGGAGLSRKRARRPVIVSVNPFRCRVWALHDRLEDYVTEESCRNEIESVRLHGQLVPAMGRPMHDDPNYDVEIVYGVRRLFVAQHLNRELQVEIREMSDRDALVAMDIENRHRKDTSAYERGLTYRRWLQMHVFESQDQIARALGISPSQVCRLIRLAHLPAVVLNAFGSPLEVREGWGNQIYAACEDEKTRALIVERARALARVSPRPSGQEVYRRLLAAAGARNNPKRSQRDEVVYGTGGKALFRIRLRNEGVSFVIRSQQASAEVIQEVSAAVRKILQNESS